ncbi:hypothetical protein [Haloarchaeobius sp. HRN-SO-5]|uniref:hypothetical protein n=1 Tax=Haloarchaeobius sp. HRN-SO-5 TaxID=3446118 RepID=UPI003EBC430D
MNVDVEPGRPLSVDRSDGRTRWTPDCVVTARDGWNGATLERYYCEIKTGDASFQRSQMETMERLANDERVLKIRVRIEDLPTQYSLTIREIEPGA